MEKAVNYKKITGEIKIGDEVILNTTAVELSLGTGGYHYVLYNYSNERKKLKNNGHIMKLRYTPLQIKCLTAEEEDSPYHEKFLNFKSLDGSIFIVGTLHSMLAPIACMIKWIDPKLNINYIMTDAGALPIDFSLTVQKLKKKNIINNTITVGHAFGGDLECTNIYNGLIASKEILNSDITIITMGPGIVGTGTKYGFSGIEQGYIIDSINTLEGIPIAVPRVSFADKRKRHFGISHHTITVLSEICKTSSNVVFPIIDKDKLSILKKQIIDNNINKKHNLIYENGDEIEKALNKYNIKVRTMGRGLKEDKEYFLTLGAIGKVAVKLYNEGGEI